MTDNIVPIVPGTVLTSIQAGRTPQPSTVEALEAMLEQARTGELQAFAAASLGANGDFKTGWTTQSNGDALLAIGALNVLINEMAVNFVSKRGRA